MTPIQQMFLGLGAVSKTYVDDVFSTYLYNGNQSARSITNGVNLAKGGLVWTKKRSATGNHMWYDTVRGATYYLKSNQVNSEGNDANTLTSFNNNGFSLGTDTGSNDTGTYSSWSFREAKGFFDIVTWTGDGGGQRNISHSLGCNIGSIMARRVDGDATWNTWHRDFDSRYGFNSNSAIYLQSTESINQGADPWGYPSPVFSSTVFSVDSRLNDNGHEYIAYLFAGGSANSLDASRSVDFDGNDNLVLGSTSDFGLGTGDFTWEAWINPTSWSTSWDTIFMVGTSPETGGFWIGKNTSQQFVVRAFSVDDQLQCDTLPVPGQWTHVAASRSGTTLKLFYNGVEVQSVTNSYDFQAGTNSRIGNDGHGGYYTGKVSNLRLVKGTAVYTENFNPTDSLTNITNTKLLCCNNSSVTGSTVTSATIAVGNGSPTASGESPVFIDQEASKFGGGDVKYEVVKCGSYEGNGSSTGPVVDLGWEPQWVMLRNANATTSWRMLDSMRGIVSSHSDDVLFPDTDAATSDDSRIDLTPTGFKLTNSDSGLNGSGNRVLYWAIRRMDPYVATPAESGTDVFAMDLGNSNTDESWTSGFPVDFALDRFHVYTSTWDAVGRLVQGYYVRTDTTAGEGAYAAYSFENNTGYGTGSWDTTAMAWMWKRGAGMDVVTYDGNSTAGHLVGHGLKAVPEMMWVKNRSSNYPFYCYHKDMNGGTNPENYNIPLNSDATETDADDIWNDTAPTSVGFTLGSANEINSSSGAYLAIMFASVTGISKVGTFTGNGTSQSISLGFQPRFLILKNATSTEKWYVVDTLRGWSGSGDQYLSLNTSYAQASGTFGEPTATGFDISGSDNWNNANGERFIYYAHA